MKNTLKTILATAALALFALEVCADADVNPPTTVVDHTSADDIADRLAEKTFVTIRQSPIKYLVPTYKGTDGNPTNGIAYWTTNTCANYTVVTSATSALTWGAAGTTNWYVVTNGTFQIDGGVICKGFVNLILCDGAKLTVQGGDRAAGIETDADGLFAVFGQSVDAASSPRPGELYAQGGGEAAGIGGRCDGTGANIVLNGGTVTAIGDNGAAGIGGGNRSAAKNIVLNGGTVTAMGGGSAAAVGGGWGRDGRGIVLNGGTVFASAPMSVERGEFTYGDLIGGGGGASTSGGAVISSAARVFFNLTGLCDGHGRTLDPVAAMPPEFEGFVVMTPGTQTVSRVLVGGGRQCRRSGPERPTGVCADQRGDGSDGCA